MVTKAAAVRKPVTAWSFSRYNDYKVCPAKFAYKHLDKLPEPPSAAMARGSEIHLMAEKFTKGELRTLPKELALFKEEFARLRKEKVKIVEEQWAYTAQWTQTAWNNWNACWLRVKLDVAYINVEHNALVPIDHKTGKFREEKNAEYEEQLELYGVAGLVQYPEVDVVAPRLWYIDHGRIYPNPEDDEPEIEYFRKDEEKLKKKWEGKVAPMFRDTTFKPTPSDAGCRYCHYRKANGGPCKF